MGREERTYWSSRRREPRLIVEMVSTPPLLSPAATPARSVRVEYLGFQDVDEHREFRLRAGGPDGWTEFRLRIAVEAFRVGRVPLQDGPDVCYRRLLQEIVAGETATPGVITIDDVALASYREAHTPVPKRRSWTDSLPSPAVAATDRPRAAPPIRAAPLVANDREPALAEGQRVSHAAFGGGVTTSSGGGRTVVHFDTGGPKTFVTSMLKVDVLSAPHTWETGPRGKNRPCRTPSPPADECVAE
jgi:hypothetical protein